MFFGNEIMLGNYMWQSRGSFVGAVIHGLVFGHKHVKVGQLVILAQKVKVGEK